MKFRFLFFARLWLTAYDVRRAARSFPSIPQFRVSHHHLDHVIGFIQLNHRKKNKRSSWKFTEDPCSDYRITLLEHPVMQFHLLKTVFFRAPSFSIFPSPETSIRAKFLNVRNILRYNFIYSTARQSIHWSIKWIKMNQWYQNNVGGNYTRGMDLRYLLVGSWRRKTETTVDGNCIRYHGRQQQQIRIH